MATLGELVEQLRAEAMDNWHDPGPPAILNAAADRLAALNRLMPAIEQIYVNVNGEDVFDGVLAAQVRHNLLALR